MFKTNKIYRFVDGTSVVIENAHNAWHFNYRDSQRYTIWDVEMHSEDEIINKLVELERNDLEYALKELERFCPNAQMPSDDAIRTGVIAGLEDYDFMDEV